MATALCAAPPSLLSGRPSLPQLTTLLPPAELTPSGGVRLSESGALVMRVDATAYQVRGPGSICWWLVWSGCV